MRISKLLIPALTALALYSPGYAQRINRGWVGEGQLTPGTGNEHRVEMARRPVTLSGNERNTTGGAPIQPRKGGSFLLGAAPGDSVFPTIYDLQSNGSMPNRLINWPDDESDISTTMIWMASTDGAPDYASRGTHLAIDDGGWAYLGKLDDEKNQNLRTGFPSFDRLLTGQYIGSLVITNHKTNGGVYFLREEGLGSSEFFGQDVPRSGPSVPGGNDGGLWARVAVSNAGPNKDLAHVIWTYQNSTGKEGVIAYTRFDNETEQWSDTVSLTAPRDADRNDVRPRATTGGDSYAMAAAGEHVVIIYQSASVSLNMIRSTDGGQTWNSYVIGSAYRLPGGYQRRYFNAAAGDSAMYVTTINDTLEYSTDTTTSWGNSLDVLVDADGNVRVVASIISVYTKYRIPQGGDTTGVFGTIYETNDVYPEVGALQYFNINADNRYTTSIIPEVSTVDGTEYYLNRRAYQSGYSRWPQLGINDLNEVFVTYTSAVKGDVKNATPKNGFREGQETPFLFSHIYAAWTSDGTEWSQPVNLTPNGLDAQFPSLADLVDTELQIAYQADDFPGDYVTDADTARAQVHPANKSSIVVLKVQASSLPRPGQSGVDRENDASTGASVAIGAVAPNPAGGLARVDYSVGRTGEISLGLYNVMGEKVLAPFSGQTLPAGRYTWTFDASSLPAGSYYVTITSGGSTSTKVLNVVK